MVLSVNRNSAHFTATLTGTSENDFPNVDGSGASTGDADPSRTAWDARGEDNVIARVVNSDSSSAATARLEYADQDDPDFNDPVTVVSGTSVSSGSAITLEDGRALGAFYRVVVSYDSTPNGDTDNMEVRFANPA